MKQALIKKVVKYKLHAARMLVDCLPPKASEQIKDFGRVILEGINENCMEAENKVAHTAKDDERLDNITIE
jgi:hypothetical protein